MGKRPIFMTRFCLLIFTFLWILLPPTAKADTSYSVKPGESLYGISKKYHLTMKEILEANQLADEKIQPGQKLIIPGVAPIGEKSVKIQKPPQIKTMENCGVEGKIPETHRVKKGENLASIAKKYNLEVEDLKEINELKDKKVKAGQILRLRLEEDDENYGGEPDQGAVRQAEKQDDSGAYVQGSGFLAGEKSRELLARVAKSFLGFRYTRGGNSVNGMDCSSYVQRVYRIFGIDLPRTAREQYQIGNAVSRNALKVGDLLFFKRTHTRQPTHVGIYIGDDQFIHTSQKKKQVDIESIESRYFHLRFMGAKRIEEVEAQSENRNSAGE